MSRTRLILKDALDLVATVAIIVAAAAITWSIVIQRQRPLLQAAPLIPSGAVEDVGPKGLEITLDQASVEKTGNIRLALIEYSDFECPFCGRHARETLPRIKRDFIDSRRLVYVFRHFPIESLHPNARYAAAAAACLKQSGRFWDGHSWLFANQGALTKEAVLAKVRTLGASVECVQEADSHVSRDLEEGKRLGVNSTPTFFIGEIADGDRVALRRKLNGAVPYDVFSQEIAKVSGSVSSLSAFRPGGRTD